MVGVIRSENFLWGGHERSPFKSTTAIETKKSAINDNPTTQRRWSEIHEEIQQASLNWKIVFVKSSFTPCNSVKLSTLFQLFSSSGNRLIVFKRYKVAGKSYHSFIPHVRKVIFFFYYRYVRLCLCMKWNPGLPSPPTQVNLCSLSPQAFFPNKLDDSDISETNSNSPGWGLSLGLRLGMNICIHSCTEIGDLDYLIQPTRRVGRIFKGLESREAVMFGTRHLQHLDLQAS